MPKKHKTQAGLEYLLTYGWALVLIVTLVGAVVFIIGTPTEETVFYSSDPTKIMLKSGSLTDGTAEIKMQNTTGGKITITSFSGMGNDCEINGHTGEIVVAAGGEINVVCQNVSDEELAEGLSIAYTDYASLQRNVEITATEPTETEGRTDLLLGEACTANSQCQSGICNGRCCSGECPFHQNQGNCVMCDEAGACVADPSKENEYCGQLCKVCSGGGCYSAVFLFGRAVEGAEATEYGCDETVLPEADEGCRYCDSIARCLAYTSGQHGCGVCQACGATGTCEPNAGVLEGAAATALGCEVKDEECRLCDAGSCTYYTSGQHGCTEECQACNSSGRCGYCENLVDCGWFDPACGSSWNFGGNWANGPLCDIDNSAYIDTCGGSNHDLWQELSGLVPGETYLVKWMSGCWASGYVEVILGGNSSGPLNWNDFEEELPFITITMTAGSQNNKLIVRALNPCSDIEIEDISVIPCTC